MANAKIEHGGASLAAALVKFQADLPEIGLDSENPHFRSKFASLPRITKEAFPKLAAHGLSFTAAGGYEDGQYGLKATLLHESGDERSGFFPIVATDPQKIGSAITYARRYLLASLTGIVADADDDGNAASIPTVAEQKVAAAKARTAPKQSAPSNGTARDTIRVEYIEKGLVDKDTVNKFHTEAKQSGLEGDAAFQAVLERLKKGEVG